MKELSRLHRRFGTLDAVVVGLGAMIGAGIFTAIGPASAMAGTSLLISLAIAGGLAYLNATSMAQLASVYPESGGAYVYGRNQLGNFWGFLAGWGFIIAKLASCSAMALTFASYAAPTMFRPIAVSSVVGLSIVNYFGIKKTLSFTKIILTVVLFSLSLVVIGAIAGGGADYSRIDSEVFKGEVSNIFQAAGFLFFAFAGFARIATLGEEVSEPQRTIPKAILISLGITIFVYFIVLYSTLLCVDVLQLSKSNAPLVLALESGKFYFLSPAVKIGASFASLGVLLSLLAGVSRTIFAMAAQNDLPFFFSAVHPKHRIPHRAELLVGLIVAIIVAITDLRSAIGFSAFSILVYYAIANVAAWTLKKNERLWPRWLSAAGLVSCLTIAFSLEIESIFTGVLLFILGAIYYLFNLRRKI